MCKRFVAPMVVTPIDKCNQCLMPLGREVWHSRPWATRRPCGWLALADVAHVAAGLPGNTSGPAATPVLWARLGLAAVREAQCSRCISIERGAVLETCIHIERGEVLEIYIYIERGEVLEMYIYVERSSARDIHL